MFRSIIAAVLLFGGIGPSLGAEPAIEKAPQGIPLQDLMIRDIESVRYNMEIKYAPQEWKQQYLGWTIEGACQKAIEQVYGTGASTPKEFQRIVKNLLNSAHDYHVKPLFYSTEWAYFPLGVRRIGSSYYLTDHLRDVNFSLEDMLFLEDLDPIENPEDYNESFSALAAGDEVIAIDGIPIAELIEQIIDTQLGGNRSPTGYALAERSLFCRFGKYGDDVPKGFFTLTLRHSGQGRIASYQFPWFHVPEWIMNKDLQPKAVAGASWSQRLEKYLKRDFSVQYAQELLAKRDLKAGPRLDAEEEDEDDFDCREKGDLPPLGWIVWESSQESDLYAYLYRNRKGKNIGYIYLPTFSHAGEGADEMMRQLVEVLQFFEEQSAALVLDITNNPGGNLFYMYAVLSVLTPSPMVVPKNSEILIQEDVYNAAVLKKLLEMELEESDTDFEGQTLSGYPCSLEILQGIQAYTDAIIHSWNEGKTFTDPLYVYGISRIMPHPETQYTKPVLLLINELDFSCADFFPAVLQDNQRATLFGKTTAGAGGYVRSYPHSSRFGLMGYTLTGSIAFRPNGTVLENLGVAPDVPYELTLDDVSGNYVDYIRAVNRQIDKMVN